MANFKLVNKTIKSKYPDMNIEVVRGEGYVYFVNDGVDTIPSIYTHPTSTSTDDMIRLCLEEIEYSQRQ